MIVIAEIVLLLVAFASSLPSSDDRNYVRIGNHNFTRLQTPASQRNQRVGVNRFYYFSPEKTNYVEATKICSEGDYRILQIKTSTKQREVADHLYVNDVRDELWIGLSDRDNEGVWSWYDRSRALYTNWVRYENGTTPNLNTDAADCATIRPGTDMKFQWYPDVCIERDSLEYLPRRYICEEV